MRIRTEELRPRSWISSVRCSWVKVFCIQKNNTSMPAPWTPVTAWELGISGKIDVTTCLMKRLQLSLSRWSHAWKRTRCFWHVGMIDEWLGGVWGFPNALRSQEKKSDQERYIQSSSRFNVSTLMSHRRSPTKNCCEGSWLDPPNCWWRQECCVLMVPFDQVLLRPPELLRRLQRRSQKSIEHSRFLWWFCIGFRVIVSGRQGTSVLRRPFETLKHLDLPRRSREMVVRCCDHLQTHSESLALKLWPSSNSPGVWELFGSGDDVLHPRILELQIFEDGIAVG